MCLIFYWQSNFYLQSKFQWVHHELDFKLMHGIAINSWSIIVVFPVGYRDCPFAKFSRNSIDSLVCY